MNFVKRGHAMRQFDNDNNNDTWHTTTLVSTLPCPAIVGIEHNICTSLKDSLTNWSF